jgi:hypothetical protein
VGVADPEIKCGKTTSRRIGRAKPTRLPITDHTINTNSTCLMNKENKLIPVT